MYENSTKNRRDKLGIYCREVLKPLNMGNSHLNRRSTISLKNLEGHVQGPHMPQRNSLLRKHPTQVIYFSNLAIKPSANKERWHCGWRPTELQFLSTIFPGRDIILCKPTGRFADNENYQLSALVYFLTKAFPGPWSWAPSKFTKWQQASQPSDGVGTRYEVLFLRSSTRSASVGFWQDKVGRDGRSSVS